MNSIKINIKDKSYVLDKYNRKNKRVEDIKTKIKKSHNLKDIILDMLDLIKEL